MLQYATASACKLRSLLIRWFVFILALTPILVVSYAGPSKPVRVVLITLDTLRYDSFAGRATMPRLRRWAEDATQFERFYSSSASTQPSHASMFTGLHPWEHGVIRNGMFLDDQYETVAERLQQADFATAAVVASLPVSKRLGFAQGFDHFDDEFRLGRIPDGDWTLALADRGEAGENPALEKERFYSLAGHVNERALKLLDAADADRQFFWFHYYDPHGPYGDTVGGERAWSTEVLNIAARGEDPGAALARARRLYDVDVESLDSALGRLLDRLDRDREAIDTHVVITADHGESFGEDGSMGHGRRLIPSQIHVPLVVRSSHMQAGVRQDVSGAIDIAATLLALAGVDRQLMTSAKPAVSRDLTRPVERPTWAFGMRRTYRQPFEDQRLDGSMVVIKGRLFFAVDEQGALYRGNRDGFEQHSATPVSSGKARSLRGLFRSFEESLVRLAREHQALDPEIEEKLRALGYVG